MATSTQDIQTASTREAAELSLGISRRRMASRTSAGEAAAASDREQARAMRFWLGLVLFIALILRLLLFALGPWTDLQRAIDPAAAQTLHLSINAGHSPDNAVREMDTHAATDSPAASPKARNTDHSASEQHDTPPSLLAGTASDNAASVAEPDSVTTPAGAAVATPLPPALRTPAYGWLLTLVSHLRWPVTAILLLQIVAGTLTTALVYWLGCNVLRHRWAALMAAMLVAVHPAALIAPLAVMPQTLFILFLLLGLCLAAERRGRDVGDGMAGGLSLGFAALLKPLTLWVGPVVALWMILFDRRLTTLGAAASLGLVSFAVPAGWLAYNGQPLAMLNVPALSQSVLLHTPPARLQNQLTNFFLAPSLDDLSRRLGLDLPDKAQATSAATASTSPPTDREIRYWLMLGWSGVNAMLMMTAGAGIVLLIWRRHWSALALLVGTLAWFVLTWPGGDAERWRLPVVGVEALLAASILMPAPRSRLMPWLRRRFTRPDEPEAQVIVVAPPRSGLAGRPL